MAKKRKPAAPRSEGSRGASSAQAASGKEVSMNDLTLASVMLQAEMPDKPSFKKTKYPVDKEKFKKLKLLARKMETGRGMLTPNDAATGDSDDEDKEVKELSMEMPEDGFNALGPLGLAPSGLTSFNALSETGFRPPDCTLAVGKNDVVVGVNVDMAGYSKSGTLKFKWGGFTSLFQSVLPSGSRLFDPKMIYDHYSDRYVVVAAALRESPNGSWIMLGVTQTSDPAGAYWVWALDATKNGSAASTNWADFPMLGFDTQGIYITTNQFAFAGDGSFQYAKLRILKKAELYAGGVGSSHYIKWYDFWNMKDANGDKSFTLQPCAHYRGTGGNPDAYMINCGWGEDNFLSLWTLKDPIGHWSGRTPSLSKTNITCRGYDLPPDADQPSSSTNIETNDNRLLCASFQNAGGVQRLWTCHSSKGSLSGDASARSVIQWYEIDVPTKKIIQQNYYGAKGKYYFFPAIHTDINRNAYLIFGRSSSSEFASLRQTGRRAADPAHDLQNSSLIKAGESAYTGGRWGDYFGICRDGSDPGRIWGYGEYADDSGRWGTYVYSAKF